MGLCWRILARKWAMLAHLGEKMAYLGPSWRDLATTWRQDATKKRQVQPRMAPRSAKRAQHERKSSYHKSASLKQPQIRPDPGCPPLRTSPHLSKIKVGVIRRSASDERFPSSAGPSARRNFPPTLLLNLLPFHKLSHDTYNVQRLTSASRNHFGAILG